MLGYDYHPAAEAEDQAAIDYYKEIDQGLGVKFVSQVAAAVRRAREFPESNGLVAHRLRHVITRRFPYAVIYDGKSDFHLGGGSRQPEAGLLEMAALKYEVIW